MLHEQIINLIRNGTVRITRTTDSIFEDDCGSVLLDRLHCPFKDLKLGTLDIYLDEVDEKIVINNVVEKIRIYLYLLNALVRWEYFFLLKPLYPGLLTTY